MTATAETKSLDQDVREPVDVFAKAIAVKVDMGCLGSKKKLSAAQIEVDADKDRISASKAILASQELENVRAAQRAVGSTMRQRCLPSLFKSGVYLVPKADVAEVDAILVEAQTEILNVLWPAFLAAYPGLVEADKSSLRSNWNPADYPPLSKVAASCYMDWSYVNFGVPDDLSTIDAGIMRREQEKAARRMDNIVDDIQQVLRAEMLKLVAHVTDKLTGTREGKAAGKPKVFRDTLVTNVRAFLDSFKTRNIVDDAELERLCDQARGLLDGVDPQALREQDQVRARVAQGFSEIKAQLDTMMTDRKTRLIQFDQADDIAE